MPADNYYDDGSETAPDQTSDQKDAAQSENTALLPKSFFPGKGLAPGNRCEIEVVRVHPDEVEVAYRKSDDSEAREETESESPELAGPAPPPSEMAGMME